MSNFVNEVIDLSNKTSYRLHEMINRKNSSGIIFPKYSDGEVRISEHRISEQEARFAFFSEVERLGKYKVSVETPTIKKYKFGTNPRHDQGGRSAEIDMSLYKANEEKNPILNIEFKAHNPEIKAIEKDLLKLIIEPGDGLFFHLLKSSDSGTFRNKSGTKKGIFDKYIASLNKICGNEYIISDKLFKDSKKIIFFVCCLGYKEVNNKISECFTLSKTIYLKKSENKSNIDQEVILKNIFTEPDEIQRIKCCKDGI